MEGAEGACGSAGPEAVVLLPPLHGRKGLVGSLGLMAQAAQPPSLLPVRDEDACVLEFATSAWLPYVLIHYFDSSASG